MIAALGQAKLVSIAFTKKILSRSSNGLSRIDMFCHAQDKQARQSTRLDTYLRAIFNDVAKFHRDLDRKQSLLSEPESNKSRLSDLTISL